MTDFDSFRAMLVDFGVSPNEIKLMTLAEIYGTVNKLQTRRSKHGKIPSKKEQAKADELFESIVSDDPMVRLN